MSAHAASFDRSFLLSPAERAAAFAEAKRHSRQAFFMKFIFPALSAGCLVACAWAVAHSYLSVESAADLFASDPDEVRMTNPRFNGRDEGGEAYNLRADYAVRLNDKDNSVRLNLPVVETEQGVTVTAQEGVYNGAKSSLQLEGEVTLTHPEGYRFVSESASIALEDGVVSGESMISGSGPMGEISAQSYRIEEQYKRIRFVGQTRTMIYQ